jgi:MarR family transcriptional regulator, 2-MHQ and catechol-resistance regulon repressor
MSVAGPPDTWMATMERGESFLTGVERMIRGQKRKARAPKRFELHRYPPFYLAHILHRNAENMAAALRPTPFDNSSWRVLAALHHKGGLTLTDLARGCVLERSFMGRLVVKLERAGLVKRKTSPNDRRAVTVSLTPQGQKTFNDVLLPVALRQVEVAYAGVSQREMQVFLSVLARAMENVYRAGNGFPPI